MRTPLDSAALPTVSVSTLVRVGLGLVAIIGLVAIVGALLREPIATFSGSLVADYGLPGLFATLFVTDSVPGLGFQPALFLGFTGGVLPGTLLVLAWGASLCASVFVYSVGRSLRGRPALVALLLRWRIGHWLRDYGARAIAVASVAPVPFGLATFGAGVMGLGLRDLLLGASARGVKIGFTLLAIMAGWGVGA
ncbi:MAG: hypothetical protein Q8P18_28890 [Pseudomonadota bacterium]|nr:hypothetical protein [Pseudomonadota bacterium]